MIISWNSCATSRFSISLCIISTNFILASCCTICFAWIFNSFTICIIICCCQNNLSTCHSTKSHTCIISIPITISISLIFGTLCLRCIITTISFSRYATFIINSFDNSTSVNIIITFGMSIIWVTIWSIGTYCFPTYIVSPDAFFARFSAFTLIDFILSTTI